MTLHEQLQKARREIAASMYANKDQSYMKDPDRPGNVIIDTFLGKMSVSLEFLSEMRKAANS